MMMPKGGMPTMQVVYSMGVFNARLGTCGDCCGVCCGFENSRVIPSPFSLDVNGTFDSELQFEEYNGFWFNDTSALWTATGGDTYDGNAKFTATAVGADTVDGSDFVYLTPGAGDGCTCGCPQGELDGFGDVTAMPVISGPTDVWWFGGITPSGYATSITLTTSPGSSYQWSIDAGGGEIYTSGLTDSTLTISSAASSFSSSIGDVHVSVNVDGVRSSEFDLTTREPHKLVPSTNPPAAVDMNSPQGSPITWRRPC